MRRLFLELYYKQIFSSTPITSFYLFLLYIVVTPLMLGFEKDFLCHFHLGLIWISLLFSFLSAPFFSKWERRWYTWIVLFKCLLLAKNPTSTIGRSLGYSNKLCFLWFSHVTTSVPIRSIRNGLVKHSIREPGLDSSVWYSFLFGSWNHIQQWLEQLAKFNYFTYFIALNPFLYLYWNRMVSCSFIDWLFLSVCISFSNFGLD